MKSATIGCFGAIVLLATMPVYGQIATPNSAEPANFANPAAAPRLDAQNGYCGSLVPGDPQAFALKNACVFTLTLPQNMPNFVCQMEVEKFEDISRTYRSTQQMQKIHAQARYVNGKDSYDDLKINGRPRSTNELIEGTWSFGEFSTKLLAAFDPKNHPKFKFNREIKINDVHAFEYAFHVDRRENRFWRWLFDRRSTMPGYDGKIWVSRKDGTILRLELNSADGVPDDFPIQSIESTTDYSYFDFKDRSGFVLPAKARIRTRMLDHRLYRTNISFSHCHRFVVESHLVDAPQ